MVPENDEEIETGAADEGGDEPEPVAAPAVDEFKVEKVDREAETPKPQNRREKRVAAMKENAAARERAENEARTLREENQRISRDLAEIRGRLDQQDRQARTNEPSPHAAKYKALRTQWESHAAAAVNPKLDAATRQRHVEAAENLENEMFDVRYDMRREKERESEPVDQSEARRAAEKEEQYLVARFPWLDDEKIPEAHGYAWNKFEALVKGGRPRNRATMVEACTFIASKFGFGGMASNGDNGNSRRFSAVRGGEEAGGEDSPMTIRVSEADKKLARAMYPSLDEGTAVKTWLKEVAAPHVRSRAKSA